MAQVRGEVIDRRILDFLKAQEWPCTTEDIAEAANISWQTAQIHLFKLHAEGKIKYRKVGRQNHWWLKQSYEKQF